MTEPSEDVPGGRAPITLTPVLTERWDQPDSFTRRSYERGGGYKALRKALQRSPGDVVEAVKDSGLRGRGGAGFPRHERRGEVVPEHHGVLFGRVVEGSGALRGGLDVLERVRGV